MGIDILKCEQTGWRHGTLVVLNFVTFKSEFPKEACTEWDSKVSIDCRNKPEVDLHVINTTVTVLTSHNKMFNISQLAVYLHTQHTSSVRSILSKEFIKTLNCEKITTHLVI